MHTTTRLVAAALLAISAGIAAADTCLPKAAGAAKAHLAPVADESLSEPVPARLFGASLQYQIDDDAFWGDARSVTLARDARIAMLRFPGGELADNYDWETHRVLRPDDFPYEARSEAGRNARTDYLEFLAAMKRAGIAELSFVVGVDPAFRDGGDLEASLARHAAHAAAWVKAVKDAGYFVPYWEIGNEPYGGGGYPIMASEYARALKVYAKAMRAADPRIRIGAAGPGGKVGFGSGISFADRVGPDALVELRRGKGSVIKAACPKLTTAACMEKLARRHSAPANPPEWWSVVTREAGDSFDFAVIHRYERANLEGVYKKRGFALSSHIRGLKDGLAAATGRQVPVFLTEWNTPDEKRRGTIDENTHLGEVAMMTGMGAVAGLDAALYWPMRGSIRHFKTLFTDDNRPTPVAQLFGLLGDRLVGARVAQSLPARGVYALQASRGAEDTLVLVNTTDQSVRLDWQHRPGATLSLARTQAGSDGTPSFSQCSQTVDAGGALPLALPAQSTMLLTTKP